jgi:hypothetical protein
VTWEELRRCPALKGVSALALRELLVAAQERSYQPGDLIVRQGDPADGLFILLEGTAHAQLRRQDGDQLLGRFVEGDLIGEMALVMHEPRSADVVADSPVRALLVPTAAFDQLATRHLELGLVLTKLVADRLGQSALDGLGDKLIEGFRILRCIGRGGMSIVYQAQEEATGEIVALKMMSYRLIYDAAALSRFHQESELHQGLEHGNIARLQRLFPAYRTYFLVMELCEGLDLRRLLTRCGRLPESQVRAILGQLSCALQYIHARGLVHRDLKPANVMITREGRVKLMDFGLAVPAVTDEDETQAVERSILGTPAYMAPEQLGRGQLDRRTDVYAVACVAYELLSGTRLFPATDFLELVEAKAALQLPPAAAIGDGISDELHAFMVSALRRNPADRPSSIEGLVPWAAPCDPLPEDPDDERSGDDPTR